MAGGLFEHDLPPGFHHREHFITDADERVLLDAIADVAFSDFEMRGVVARRRVAFFGQSYDRVRADSLGLNPATPSDQSISTPKSVGTSVAA